MEPQQSGIINTETNTTSASSPPRITRKDAPPPIHISAPDSSSRPLSSSGLSSSEVTPMPHVNVDTNAQAPPHSPLPPRKPVALPSPKPYAGAEMSPALPPREGDGAGDRDGAMDGDGSGEGGKKGTGVAGIWATTKDYAGWWAKHVKKGEMPWTQWYCCGKVTVDGQPVECEQENHRIHKTCKKCKHRVCENCVKGTL